jgi:DNA replicative helicase MCM subunit Mcm2 (Cdc46/Mcm family)
VRSPRSNYITIAKQTNPYVSPELTDFIVGIYVHMRQDEARVSDCD